MRSEGRNAATLGSDTTKTIPAPTGRCIPAQGATLGMREVERMRSEGRNAATWARTQRKRFPAQRDYAYQPRVQPWECEGRTVTTCGIQQQEKYERVSQAHTTFRQTI
jgi:hypothetical protein